MINDIDWLEHLETIYNSLLMGDFEFWLSKNWCLPKWFCHKMGVPNCVGEISTPTLINEDLLPFYHIKPCFSIIFENWSVTILRIVCREIDDSTPKSFFFKRCSTANLMENRWIHINLPQVVNYEHSLSK